MSLVVPNEGETVILNRLVNQEPGASLLLDLYSNDITPNANSVLSDFTLCTGGGYAQVVLANTAWVLSPGAPTVANTIAQLFTWTGIPATNTVYGYVVHTGTKVVGAERFPADAVPFVVTLVGDTVSITPQLTCGSLSGN